VDQGTVYALGLNIARCDPVRNLSQIDSYICANFFFTTMFRWPFRSRTITTSIALTSASATQNATCGKWGHVIASWRHWGR
jgi:hypothetical protein